ncbi:MAG: PH domain-containing protein [Rhodoglobus sp.]
MSTDDHSREVVVARLRPHARALFWPTLLLVVIAGALGFFSGRLTESWQVIAALGAAGIVVVAGWLFPLCGWLARNYTITTRRIVLRSGIFVRLRQELLHSRGHDVTVRKTALQSVFGSGDVLVNTGLDHPVVLRDVPSADLVQAALHDLMESATNRPPASDRVHA